MHDKPGHWPPGRSEAATFRDHRSLPTCLTLEEPITHLTLRKSVGTARSQCVHPILVGHLLPSRPLPRTESSPSGHPSLLVVCILFGSVLSSPPHQSLEALPQDRPISTLVTTSRRLHPAGFCAVISTSPVPRGFSTRQTYLNVSCHCSSSAFCWVLCCHLHLTSL